MLMQHPPFVNFTNRHTPYPDFSSANAAWPQRTVWTEVSKARRRSLWLRKGRG